MNAYISAATAEGCKILIAEKRTVRKLAVFKLVIMRMFVNSDNCFPCLFYFVNISDGLYVSVNYSSIKVSFMFVKI